MSLSEEEFSTPKIGGEGDVLKTSSMKKRVPFTSARKFNARIQKDDGVLMQLQTALSDLQQKPKVHNCLKKSMTVAEITPTKSKVRRRPPKITAGADSDANQEVDTVTLHATPRRPSMNRTPPRQCPREKVACDVYRRLMLLCWRRYRTHLAESLDKCERQENQIHQFELQIDVLQNLRNSECSKRKEAMSELQQLKQRLGILEHENIALTEELKNLKDTLEDSRQNLKLTKCDLKRYSVQFGKLQEQLKKKKEEKLDLISQLTNQKREIYSQNSIISRMEEILKTTALNLQNTQSSLKVKGEQYQEALLQIQTGEDVNSSLKQQIANLENLVDTFTSSCEYLKEENTTIKSNLEEVSLELCEAKKNNWIKYSKDLAVMSLSALHKAADILLPVYLDKPF